MWIVTRSPSHHMSGTFTTQWPPGFSTFRIPPKIERMASEYSSSGMVPRSRGSWEYCSTAPSCSFLRSRRDLFRRCLFSRFAYGGDVSTSDTLPGSRYSATLEASSWTAT